MSGPAHGVHRRRPPKVARWDEPTLPVVVLDRRKKPRVGCRSRWCALSFHVRRPPRPKTSTSEDLHARRPHGPKTTRTEDHAERRRGAAARPPHPRGEGPAERRIREDGRGSHVAGHLGSDEQGATRYGGGQPLSTPTCRGRAGFSASRGITGEMRSGHAIRPAAVHRIHAASRRPTRGTSSPRGSTLRDEEGGAE